MTPFLFRTIVFVRWMRWSRWKTEESQALMGWIHLPQWLMDPIKCYCIILLMQWVPTTHQQDFADQTRMLTFWSDHNAAAKRRWGFLSEDEIDAVKSLTKEVSATSGSKRSGGDVGSRWGAAQGPSLRRRQSTVDSRHTVSLRTNFQKTFLVPPHVAPKKKPHVCNFFSAYIIIIM